VKTARENTGNRKFVILKYKISKYPQKQQVPEGKWKINFEREIYKPDMINENFEKLKGIANNGNCSWKYN
jgi:hypothetical protein